MPERTTSTPVATVVPLPFAGRDFQLEWSFEEDYQRDRREFQAGLDSAHLERAPGLEVQLELPRGKRGGKHDAPEIDLEHLERLARLVHGTAAPKRWSGNAPTFADLSSPELAGRLPWIAAHRGRPGGPSAQDYAAQREWSRSRSASISYWTRKAAFAYRLPQAPPAIAELLGRSRPRRAIVGMICTAANAGWLGITGSAPEFCSLLDIAVSTFWEAIHWLRERSLIVTVRRYVPNDEPGAAPVCIGSNWYGPGPALLDRAGWWHASAAQTSFEAAWDYLRRERLKRRAKLAKRGTALPFVDRVEWARVVLGAAIEWSSEQAAWLELEKEEAQRVARMLERQTWEPPPVLVAPKTDPRAELFARALEAAEELGEEGYLEEARRAGEAIAAWRAGPGRGRDDDGYSAGAELENMVRRIEALAELEARAEELARAELGEEEEEEAEELARFAAEELAEELAEPDDQAELAELAEELAADAQVDEELEEALEHLAALSRENQAPMMSRSRDTIRKPDAPPVNRKIRRTGTSESTPSTGESAAAELRRSLAALSSRATSRVDRAIDAIREVLEDPDDHR